jgi:hypothetical protein
MSIQQKINVKKVCLLVVAVVLVVATAYLSLTPSQNEQTAQNEIESTTPVATSEVTPEALVASATQVQAKPEPAPIPQPVVDVFSGKIGKGATASTILNKWLSKADVYQLASATDKAFRLTKLRRGRPYRVVTTDGEFTRFEYEIDNDQYLSVAKTEDGFAAERKDIKYDVITERVYGVITSSLYEALTATGEKASLAVRIGDIFGWEIDFIRDIRKNDNFTVVVEKRFREGKFQGYGDILAARFVAG